jgi:alkylhydroperoxidase family enzyme
MSAAAKLASAPPDSLLALLKPELRERYTAFVGTPDADALVAPELLALGRGVIDAAHGLGPWPKPASDAERAVLALAEKIPFAYQEVSDADFAALKKHLPDAQVVALVFTLCLHDAHRRLAAAWPAPGK